MRNIFQCWSCGRTLTLDKEDQRRPTKCPCTRPAWIRISHTKEQGPYVDLLWLELESQLEN